MFRPASADRIGGIAGPRAPALCVVIVSWVAVFLHAATTQADEVVGATDSKVYHSQKDCPALKKITIENRVVFKSAATAQAEGRRLCRVCEKQSAKAAVQPEKPPGPTKPVEAKPPPEPTSRPAEKDSASEPGRLVRIKKVLPGGTLVLDSGEKIALAGVCLPQGGQEQSQEAASFIQERLRGRKARWLPVMVDDANPVRDAFGRTLGALRTDGRRPDVGGDLIAGGLAWVDRSLRMEGAEQYLSLETEAWQKGRGIWRRLADDVGRAEVVVGRYGLSYHPRGCPHTDHLTESSMITLNEAKARRLTPCEHYRSGLGSAESSSSRDAGKTHHAKEKDE